MGVSETGRLCEIRVETGGVSYIVGDLLESLEGDWLW